MRVVDRRSYHKYEESTARSVRHVLSSLLSSDLSDFESYPISISMATMAETVEFGQYPLQVRPAPLRSRSWNKGESIIVAPPPSRGSSLQNWDQLPEKVDTELPPADRGSGAWKFLFAASMIEGFMFGASVEALVICKLTRQDFH